MSNQTIKFPKDFIWGTSTSAHQIEGGNINDWSEWEHQNAERLGSEAEAKYAKDIPNWSAINKQATDPNNYISGKATDHYHRFGEDIALLKLLGIQAFRLSIEWSRIEPEPGKFNYSELEHYRSVIQELKANGVEPWVTLWHRTNPLWIRDMGDWENKITVECYLKFVEKVVREFGSEVKTWMPLNEPIMSLSGGYLGGVYPPAKKSWLSAYRVFGNFIAAQKGCYKIIHNLTTNSKVGIAQAAVYTEAYKGRWYNKILVKIIHYLANWKFLNEIESYADFIGVQYYSRGLININLKPGKGRAKFVQEIKEREWQSDMGWEVYPEGLYFFIKELSKRYNKPIYITENGIADAEDKTREKFIREHLKWIHKAAEEGANVKGYFYWSLLDNLEWDKGFWPRFGLAEVNYRTFERKLRPSAFKYAEIIKNNGFDSNENI